MEILIIWVFAAYGMSTILVYGSIFDRPRNWIIAKSKFFGELIKCMLCTSTWVGFFMSLCFGGFINYYIEEIEWYQCLFFDGMFTAGAVWAINAVVEFFEESRIK